VREAALGCLLLRGEDGGLPDFLDRGVLAICPFPHLDAEYCTEVNSVEPALWIGT
jgi:hypothetical protein